MSLIDLISSEEKEMIDYFRDMAIGEATNNPDLNNVKNAMVSVESWLNYWEEAKHHNHLDSVFGKSLILKRQYKYHEDNDTIENMMYDNLCRSSDFMSLKYGIIELLNKDDRNAEITYGYNNILSKYIMNPKAFALNTYDGPKVTVYFSDEKKFVLSPGSKLMKDIGILAKHCNLEEAFERLRIAHSQILNETSFNCNLCLSIHPLDYITASYNENDWRSCMCWASGDYCRGVVEMMNSPCVIVAYIESNHEYVQAGYYNSYRKEEETLAKYRWNSKKWREFFIVDEKVLSGIKGYPYWNRSLEEYCLSWLRELFNPFFDYEENMRLYNGHIYLENDKFINLNFYCGPAMYNDFCHSDYRMFVSNKILTNVEANSYYEINYSGASECVVCGDIYSEFEESSDLCCLDCVNKVRCTSCNEIIYGDIYEIDGEYYCHDCFENLPTCHHCGSQIGGEMIENSFYFVSDEFFEEHKDEDKITLETRNLIEDENGEKCYSICGDCTDKLKRLYPDKIKAAAYRPHSFWWIVDEYIYCAPISIRSQVVEDLD